MTMLEGFRIMERAWDPVNSTVVKQGQGHMRVYPGSAPEGKDLRPACLTLYYCGVYRDVLQWWRRLDLAKVKKIEITSVEVEVKSE
jgi:hypothetical protein